MQRRNSKVTEQLLSELEAGRFDSALVRRILDTPSAFPRLLRACYLAQEGRYGSARADVDAALEHRADNPVISLAAGMVCFATRDYQRALDLFEQAGELSPRARRRGRQLAIGAAGGLGWEHDVRHLLELAVSEEPQHAAWHAQAVRFFTRGRHWTKALEHALRALEIAPETPHLWMEAAGLHARLDQREQALAALERALALADTDGERPELIYRLEGARVAVDASDFGLAVACLERALELDPNQPEVHVQLAEIHSWKGEAAAAQARAEQALALAPEHAGALRMLGGLAVLAKDYDAAIELLTRAIASRVEEYQAHVWLTEAYLRSERYEEAHAQLHQGTMNAGGFLFVAWLLRFLIVAYSENAPLENITPNRTEEFAAALVELAPALGRKALDSRDVDDTVAAVEAALAALRGNRSIYATHVVDGGLERLHARSGCRFESRWILQLLRVAPGEECLALFDEMLPRYPGSSLPICHRGELHLWLGNFELARADLEQAVELVEGTRWAYMGLSTLNLLADDPEGCLAINAHGVEVMKNTEGPAIYVYRGEAKRKLGRHAEAIEELRESVRWHPARASGTINLALAYQATGEREGFDEMWLRLRDEQASGLLSDAAHELGVAIVGDPDWEPEDAVKIAVLERALEMMGGNRSSGLITYWTAEGRMRFVQRWPHGGRGPHQRDHEHLEQAKRMLLRALASYRGPRG
nr:tetratricopeptide repeat protein [Pseudenhygromyxa sp. WMMC2535]